VSSMVIDDCLALIDAFAPTIDRLDGEVHERAKADPRVKVLTGLPGVGEFTALVILAEVGDVSRFPNARKLTAWAGLTPTVRGSDTHVRHGHISKQGSAWLRWILCEAAQTAKRHPDFAAGYTAMAHRRGKKIATTAVARKLLARAWHLLTAAETRRLETGRHTPPTSPKAKTTTTDTKRAPGTRRTHPKTGTVTSPGRARKTA
jgi:transposase